MPLQRLSLDRFTAFKSLDISFNPRMNVFIGENGTGKTHLMKLLYSLCSVTASGGKRVLKPPLEKILSVFLPSEMQASRLITRSRGRAQSTIVAVRDDVSFNLSFSRQWKKMGDEKMNGLEEWARSHVKSVYIPVKEMLANAPGFAALYDTHALHFEEIYRDIITQASIPVLRGPASRIRKKLEGTLEKAINGSIFQGDSGEFFLSDASGNLEFTLLSEGMRKLALLLLLIKNNVLASGSVLFWDEPESNLNPSQTQCVVKVMRELTRQGIQIFVATHDYIMAKEIDMIHKTGNGVSFFSFFRNKKGDVDYDTAPTFDGLGVNSIVESFESQYERYLNQSFME